MQSGFNIILQKLGLAAERREEETANGIAIIFERSGFDYFPC